MSHANETPGLDPPGRGLREAHAHLGALGEWLGLHRVDACPSLAACLDAVRAEIARLRPSAGVIRLAGARPDAWPERRGPSRTELDAAAGATPCVVLCFDHHTAWANSATLAHAGLRAGVPVPPNGVVEVGPDGEATGLLREQAAYAAWGLVGPEGTPRPHETVRRALESLSRMGFSEVHDLHSQEWLAGVLRDLDAAGELPVSSVWLYPPVARLEADLERAPAREGRVRIAGGKVFVDGTLSARTALVLEPYRDAHPDHPLGVAMLTVAELEGALRTASRAGRHLAAHAIGDGAVRVVLDAIERTGIASDDAGIRARIEHAELIDGADLPRFAALDVVCSVQPCHLLTDIEVLRTALPHRLDRVLPLRSLVSAGCTPGNSLWFGSDAPIVRADPEGSIVAATSRRRPGMAASDAIGWPERLTADEAWRAFRPMPR